MKVDNNRAMSGSNNNGNGRSGNGSFVDNNMTSTSSSSSSSTTTKFANQDLTVAVIGCGPGGMYYCHAIESIMKKKMNNNNKSSLLKMNNVSVTCFERASKPGGVWKDAADEQKHEQKQSNASTTSIQPPDCSSTMYDGLYTNGASHCVEMFDYTFDEHFQRPVSVYISRKELLGYMIGRVTKNCPNFFNKYVEFQKDIINVTYSDHDKKFNIMIRDLQNDTIETRYFDKCIWAGGRNCRPHIPASLWKLFLEGGFFRNDQEEEEDMKEKGQDVDGINPVRRCNRRRLIHSADTANLSNDVCGKRILVVGGGYSAEDITLQALKLGAQFVHIVTRSSAGIEVCVCATNAWPMNKVQVHTDVEISNVITNNNNSRCTIQFENVEWSWPNTYKRSSSSDNNDVEQDAPAFELYDIDTVICATGYNVDLSMLHESLRAYPILGQQQFYPLEFPSDDDDNDNWTMPLPIDDVGKEVLECTREILENADIDEDMIDNIMNIRPKTGDNASSSSSEEEDGTRLIHHGDYTHPNFYRGVLISNPNMMYTWTYTEHPLLDIDVSSWFLAGLTLGTIDMPSVIEMKRWVQEKSLVEFATVPNMRFIMDERFTRLFASGYDDDLHEEHYEKIVEQESQYRVRLLARDMIDAQYPFSIGTYEKLNKKGRMLHEYDGESWRHRRNLNDADLQENPWKTFRDQNQIETNKLCSIHTGTNAVPLTRKWMDIDTASSSSLAAFSVSSTPEIGPAVDLAAEPPQSNGKSIRLVEDKGKRPIVEMESYEPTDDKLKELRTNFVHKDAATYKNNERSAPYSAWEENQEDQRDDVRVQND